jgi:endoglucanase
MKDGMAKMKRILSCVALAAALMTSANAATFQAKRGISLDIWVTWPDESKWGDREVMLPFPEWRKHVGAKELADLKAAGFDFVRMPIDPAAFLSDKTEAIREDMFNEVAASVDLVTQAGFKVILDLHAIPRGGERNIGTEQLLKDKKLFARHAVLVQRMAKLLTNHIPETVALELFNEPTSDCKGAEAERWSGQLKQLHAAAREVTSKVTLILSGACWGSAEGLAALDPKDFADDNLVWSFHSYDPFILTHQGATWTGDFTPHVYGLPFPLHTADKGVLANALDTIRARIKKDAPKARRSGHLAYLDEEIAKIDTEKGLASEMDKPFNIVVKWAEKNGVDPANILLGEFGMIRQEYGNPLVVPGEYRAAYVKAMAGRAEKAGFMWSVWSYGGAFGVVDGFDGEKASGEVLEAVREMGGVGVN